MSSKLKSRKFWITVVAAVLMVLNKGLDLGLPEDTINAIAAVVIGYLVAEGAADAVGALKK